MKITIFELPSDPRTEAEQLAEIKAALAKIKSRLTPAERERLIGKLREEHRRDRDRRR